MTAADDAHMTDQAAAEEPDMQPSVNGATDARRVKQESAQNNAVELSLHVSTDTRVLDGPAGNGFVREDPSDVSDTWGAASVLHDAPQRPGVLLPTSSKAENTSSAVTSLM